MKMEQTECSETSAYKFQTPGNHPKESIQLFLSFLRVLLFFSFLESFEMWCWRRMEKFSWTDHKICVTGELSETANCATFFL